MTKRYMIFGGYNYYPRGGIGDFLGSVESIEEISASYSRKFTDGYILTFNGSDHTVDWFHVFDTVNNLESLVEIKDA